MTNFFLVYKAPGLASANPDFYLCKACINIPMPRYQCLVSWAGEEAEADCDPPACNLVPSHLLPEPTSPQCQQRELRFLPLLKSQRNRLAKQKWHQSSASMGEPSRERQIKREREKHQILHKYIHVFSVWCMGTN